MPECRTWALSQKFASSSHQKIIFLFFLFSFCALNLLIWGGFSCLIPLNDRNEETKKRPGRHKEVYLNSRLGRLKLAMKLYGNL